MIEEIAPVLDKVESVHLTLTKDGNQISVLCTTHGGGIDNIPPFVLKGTTDELDIQLGLELSLLGQEIEQFTSNMKEIREALAKKQEEAKKSTSSSSSSSSSPSSTTSKKAASKAKKVEVMEVIKHELKPKPNTKLEPVSSSSDEDDLFADLGDL